MNIYNVQLHALTVENSTMEAEIKRLKENLRAGREDFEKIDQLPQDSNRSLVSPMNRRQGNVECTTNAVEDKEAELVELRQEVADLKMKISSLDQLNADQAAKLSTLETQMLPNLQHRAACDLEQSGNGI